MPKVDIRLAETQQKFYDFYKTNLQSLYSELERERRDCLKMLLKAVALCVATVIFLILLYHFDILTSEILAAQWFSILSALLIIAFCMMLCAPFWQYNSVTKSKVMKKIISFWGNFSYQSSDIIGKDAVNRSELFSYFNRSEVDDSYKGEYHGTQIKISEHSLKIRGNRGETNIFIGVLIMLELPQKNKGKTLALNCGRNINFLRNNPLILLVLLFMLSPTAMVYYYYFTEPDVPFGLLFTWIPVCLPLLIVGIAYWIYRRLHPKKATQKVVLEGLPFMKKWRVLTDNQVEARYILTPVFMEKMLEIKRLFRGKHIDFSFWNNKLLIAVHTRKDMFETTSLFTSALSYHKIRDVVSQMYAIFSVIDVILGKNKK